MSNLKTYTMDCTTTESPEPSGTIRSNEAPTVPLSPHRNSNLRLVLKTDVVLVKCRRDEHYYDRSDERYYVQDWNGDVHSQNEFKIRLKISFLKYKTTTILLIFLYFVYHLCIEEIRLYLLYWIHFSIYVISRQSTLLYVHSNTLHGILNYY